MLSRNYEFYFSFQFFSRFYRAEDIPLLFSLLSDVFPNVGYTRAEMKGLKDEIRKVCTEEYLVCGEGDEAGTHWMEKVGVLQFV